MASVSDGIKLGFGYMVFRAIVAIAIIFGLFVACSSLMVYEGCRQKEERAKKLYEPSRKATTYGSKNRL